MLPKAQSFQSDGLREVDQ